MSSSLTSILTFSIFVAATAAGAESVPSPAANPEAPKSSQSAMAPADILKDARTMISQGNLVAAEALLLPLADDAFQPALKELTNLYRRSDSPLKNEDRAIDLDLKALAAGAQINVVPAQRYAASLLETDPARYRAIIEAISTGEGFKAWIPLGNARLRGIGGPVDEAGAYAAYLEAAKADESFANLNLARMSKEGRGTAVDPKAALAFYEAALSGSDAESIVAERELIMGHLMGGFGDLSDVRVGVVFAQKLLDEGSESAAIAILSTPVRMDASAPGLTDLRPQALEIGKTMAAKGDALAAKRVMSYLHGNILTQEGSISALNEALAFATEFEPILEKGQIARTRALNAAITSTDVQEIARIAADMDPADVSGSIPELHRFNQNAYVALLQAELERRGYFSGKKSGMLNQRTISSINASCRSVGLDDVCESGPLKRQNVIEIAKAIKA